jgi:hypothetical protein
MSQLGTGQSTYIYTIAGHDSTWTQALTSNCNKKRLALAKWTKLKAPKTKSGQRKLHKLGSYSVDCAIALTFRPATKMRMARSCKIGNSQNFRLSKSQRDMTGQAGSGVSSQHT